MVSLLLNQLGDSFNRILGIEEAVIIKNNMSYPLVAAVAQTDLLRIDELIENIIRPLTQKKGIEAFQANLENARSGILDGTLRSIRDVEVVLVSTGRVSNTLMSRLSKQMLKILSGVLNRSRYLSDFEIF